jgi:hypothetical protein
VYFQLVLLDEPGLGQELANVLALVALKLKHLAVLWVLDHGAVAGELLLASSRE